ncbi:MAG TPA: cytochrome d ubiquinol oxidase subunit II [Geminicoccaceae bacterium]|nr:cytochrome d ubiquinol oxidase subunit II [Geminicoccaceae bacterium]
MDLDLPLIFAGIIAFAIIMYVIMDGFDLGVGMLFPFAPSERDRDTMMNSVAPIWDGNETWLVLGGGGLLAAFPLAYALLLPAFYLPIIVMVLGLVFRGVAFEIRFKARRTKLWWSTAFTFGSLVATLAQGLVLGAFIQGVTIQERDFAGGAFDWLTPFSLFTAIGLVGGYAMLGCSWLIMKTEHELQDWAYRMMLPISVLVLIAIAGVSLWTPFLDTHIAERWFTWPNLLYLSPVPLLVAACALALAWSVATRHETLPFLLTLGLFLLSYLGLGISLWPYIVPPSVTIWDAAAPDKSLAFTLVGVVVLIPLILGYTAYGYWVFRGKVATDEGYH